MDCKFLLLIVPLVLIMGCRKNDDELTVDNPTTTIQIEGNVELPEGINSEDMVICNLVEEKTLEGDNVFGFEQINTIFLFNQKEERITYIGYPGTDEKDSYVLNAKETALFMTMRVIPFALAEENTDVIYELKKLLYENIPEIKALESAIIQSVVVNGYLEPSIISAEWRLAIDKVIEVLELDKFSPLRNGFAEGSTYAMQVRYPDGDENYEGDKEDSDGNWRIKRDFYNKYQSYLGFTVGNYNSSTSQVSFDGQDIVGYIRPYNLGAFLDGITDLPTWKQYFRDLFITLVYDINHNPTWDASKTSLYFDVKAPDQDAMVFISPKENTKVQIYNIAHIFLDFLAGTLNEANLVDDFVEHLISESPGLVIQITNAFKAQEFTEVADLLFSNFRDFFEQQAQEAVLDLITDGLIDEYLLGVEILVLEKIGNTAGFFMDLFSTENFAMPIDFQGKNPPSSPVVINPGHLVQLNNEFTTILKWSANDLDGDDLTYDVYLGTNLEDLALYAENISESQVSINIMVNTRYIWRVVASDGTYKTEGPIWAFDNGETSELGVMVDERDGQVYRWVKIGNQKWMRDNLNYEVPDSYCYENNSGDCGKYGRLYTWDVLMNGFNDSDSNPSQVRGLCPKGWHVPSNSEYEELIQFFDLSLLNVNIGGLLKSTTSDWISPNEGAIDLVKFSGLPAGRRIHDGSGFDELGNQTWFWTSTHFTGILKRARNLKSENDKFSNPTISKNYAFSCRCVEDNEEIGVVEEDGSFIDPRDGQMYQTIQIGDQIWMAENMNWSGAGSCYDNEPQNCDEYGRLYTHSEAENVCPPGWHLPTTYEWIILGQNYDEAIMNNYNICKSSGEAFRNLIEGGESGFNAKLAGRKTGTGYFRINEFAYFRVPGASTYVQFHASSISNSGCIIFHYGPSSPANFGFSCRCVKD